MQGLAASRRFLIGLTGLAGAATGLAACGSDDQGDSSGDVTSTVQMAATDFAFRADARIVIEAGDTVEFVVRNEGAVEHEMELLTDASRRLAKTDRIAPGASDSLIATFDEPGVYTVICDIDNHRSLGQMAQFEVIAGASEEG
ncbi:MAG: cupredoxin domain-containing protein [Ilumatobacter sp.]